MPHNFKICNADTDSISFCKPDGSEFAKAEQDVLLKELNSLFPSTIQWEHDGLFQQFLILAGKNYVLVKEDGKRELKGSAIKASTKEPALKQFILEIIDLILTGKETYEQVYLGYVKEIMSVTDMKRWVSRKTITDKVLENDRTNEKKVRDAIQGTEYVEGDRIYTYFLPDGTLSLLERFNGDYDKRILLKKLFDTSKVFSAVLDTPQLFPNFSLVKNQDLLEELTGLRLPKASRKSSKVNVEVEDQGDLMGVAL